MRKHIFIINPEAGKKKGLELTEYINENYKDAVILKTEYPSHASELATAHAGKDTTIYSVGGDGTLNEVINGVMQSDYPLETAVANVPCGSGNDFIKGLTDIKDPVKLLECYKKQEYRTIDIGKINDRYFLNISSVGFDAEIVLNAKKYKRLPMLSAELAYVISVFATLIRLRAYSLTMTIDDQAPVEKKALFIVMANGKFYGGGMKPAPEAELDDGLFDFCLVDEVPRWKVPFLLPKFIKGNHESLSVVKMMRGQKMTITGDQPLPLNIDGEVSRSDKVEVTIKKGAMTLVMP